MKSKNEQVMLGKEMLANLEDKNAYVPFLAGKDGKIDTHPVRNASNGKELQGERLIKAKMELNKIGKPNENILTFAQATALGTGIKENAKYFTLSYYDKKEDKTKHIKYFPESEVIDKSKILFPAREENAKTKDTTNDIKTFSETLKDLLENEKESVPFLAGKDGKIDTRSVRNAATNYEFKGLNLIMAKTYLKKLGKSNENILTAKQARMLGTAIREGAEGFTISFNDRKTNEIKKIEYFPESAVLDPSRLPFAANKIQEVENEKPKENKTASMDQIYHEADPVVYITNYLRSVQTGEAFSPSFEVQEKFRQNLITALDKDIFSLGKFCKEASKTLSKENEATQKLEKETKQEKKQSVEMDVSR